MRSSHVGMHGHHRDQASLYKKTHHDCKFLPLRKLRYIGNKKRDFNLLRIKGPVAQARNRSELKVV